MTKTRTVLCIVGAAMGASSANAQQVLMDIDWKVNGQASYDAVPGETVTVTAEASWDDLFGAFPIFAGTQFTVELDGAEIADVVNYDEFSGLGRPLHLNGAPGMLTDVPMAGGRQIINVIDFQLAGFLNPMADTSNPIGIFTFEYTPATGDRTVEIGSTHSSAAVYDATGLTNVPAFTTVNGATVNVVPTPASVALAGLGGLAFGLKRRR